MNVAELIRDPLVLAAAAAGVVVLVLIVVLLTRKSSGPRGRVVDDTRARARQRLKSDLRTFRDELKRAAALAEPVFRKIDTETAHADVIGHWRRGLKHRISVRSPDLGALKGVARAIGCDAMPLSDLEASWRKVERQILEYNGGKLDGSKTPIATVRQFEKDLQKIVVLVNICITKYEA